MQNEECRMRSQAERLVCAALRNLSRLDSASEFRILHSAFFIPN